MKQLFLKSATLLAFIAISLVCATDISAQSGTVSGTVTDEAGLPLIACFVGVGKESYFIAFQRHQHFSR